MNHRDRAAAAMTAQLAAKTPMAFDDIDGAEEEFKRIARIGQALTDAALGRPRP